MLKTDVASILPGGGAGALKGTSWGSWDPVYVNICTQFTCFTGTKVQILTQRAASQVTGVPRVGCTDTLTHAYEARFLRDGTEVGSPVNRFYGSTTFAPRGKGMSEAGYTAAQVYTCISSRRARGSAACGTCASASGSCMPEAGYLMQLCMHRKQMPYAAPAREGLEQTERAARTNAPTLVVIAASPTLFNVPRAASRVRCRCTGTRNMRVDLVLTRYSALLVQKYKN